MYCNFKCKIGDCSNLRSKLQFTLFTFSILASYKNSKGFERFNGQYEDHVDGNPKTRINLTFKRRTATPNFPKGFNFTIQIEDAFSFNSTSPW